MSPEGPPGLPPGPGLDALLRVSAAIACAPPTEWAGVMQEAAVRCPPEKVEESLLQSYLFLGFPAAINALGAWRELDPVDPGRHAREDPDLETRRARGEANCRRIYGPAYEALRARMRELHPALDRWMIEEGYGKGLARPALTVRERELCAVALLAAGGYGPQLGAHARGALRVGATRSEVGRAVEIGTDAAGTGPPRRDPDRMRAVWASIEEGLEDGCSSISSESG